MYSQNGEDDIIAGLFDQQPGRLLEIGAWAPESLSNSRLLIERDWEAILVEFSPRPVRELVEFYGRHERVKILQAAVHPCDSGLARFEISDDALSSDRAEHVAKWGDRGGFFGALWVPQLPVASLFVQFGGGFDFISVDTEGTSVDVAIAIVRDCCQRPRVMCVEYDARLQELLQAMQQFGYRAHHVNNENVILVR